MKNHTGAFPRPRSEIILTRSSSVTGFERSFESALKLSNVCAIAADTCITFFLYYKGSKTS